MKIIHTSDWHLGKIIYSRSLLPEQRHFVNNIFIPLLKSEEPDMVIIAGDIFDRQIAPTDAINLFDETVTTIINELHIPLTVISGNHDSGERMSFASTILKDRGLFINSRISQNPKPVTVEKDGTKVNIWSLPFFEPADVRMLSGDESIRGYKESFEYAIGTIKDAMKNTDADKNILVTHCFVAGGQGCESENPIYVGGSAEVPRSVFDGFDYVALGHLHGPQVMGNLCYSGSPLKYSFDEEHQHKSVISLNIEKGKEIKLDKVGITPLHDMRTITGTFDDIIAAAKNDKLSDDFIYIKLMDENPVYEPMARIKEFYPNALTLDNYAFMSSNLENETRNEIREKIKSGDQLYIFNEFLRQMAGRDATKEETDLFNKFMKQDADED